jgi:medium-chain acyl-[acyl-carrier-protein] hydrolase
MTPWIRITDPRPAARIRLFCFPYAGGAASMFRGWQQHLSPEVELCPIQLPGRENRIREQPFTSAAELVRHLIPAILPALDRPFALFGHSMGALIAYEVAQQLHHLHRRVPTCLLVSGRRAPLLPEPDTLLHTVTGDHAFLSELRTRYNNLPDILFEDTEIQELYLPLLRADFTLVETYRPVQTTPLPCPIFAFGGEDDARASGDALMAWRELTESDFDIRQFPGGHFYFKDHIRPLLDSIARHLAPSNP